MMSALLYQCCRLSFAILYPTYSSFKAVRGKNVREYVKWMMYWIVFAIFSFIEVFADILISWFPFYYIVKLCFILWLVLPATKGSSLLYRKVIHTQLVNREKEIDAYVEKAKDQSCTALIALASRGFAFVTNLIVSTAAKSQSKIADTLHRGLSVSLSDLSSDTGLGSRSISSLSLASDDVNVDEADTQQLSRDKLERELMIAYSRRRPLIRPLDLAPTYEEGRVSHQNPYNTRSAQARKHDDLQSPRLRSAPARRRLAQSPSSSTASSSVGDEEFETLDVDCLSISSTSPRSAASIISCTTSASPTTSHATSPASWRSRSSYSK